MIEYRAIDARTAKAAGLPDWSDVYDDWNPYWVGVWMFVDGVATKLIGSDGGEPEDQTMGRDWSWVVPALNEAYRLGVVNEAYRLGVQLTSSPENVEEPT